MIDWWNSLTLVSQIFYCIAVPSTLLLLIQTIMMLVGLGDDAASDIGDVDVSDADVSEGVFGDNEITEIPDDFGLEGLRILTVKEIISFLVVFGWVGIVLESVGAQLFITIPVSAVCGLATMLLLAFLMRAVMKLRSDGNIDTKNAIGTSGKVYLTIPPARSGEGKVQLLLQGSFVELGAVTDDETAIPTGSEIVVVGVSGQTDLVVRRK
jgi:membrane protein implicated in regulation of membrane protease activity